jgi:hypothetical protein
MTALATFSSFGWPEKGLFVLDARANQHQGIIKDVRGLASGKHKM